MVFFFTSDFIVLILEKNLQEKFMQRPYRLVGLKNVQKGINKTG